MAEFNWYLRTKMLLSLKRNTAKFYERYGVFGGGLPSDEKYKSEIKALRKSIIGGNHLFIEHFELIITTKCSLNCKRCSNLMPEYRKRQTAYFRDKEDILKEIDALADSVDEILNCRILGGEPLLHPDLPEILSYLFEKKNIGSIHIITNGTIIPNETLLDVMKNERLLVIFSDYGKLSRNLTSCSELLKKEGIKCSTDVVLKWSDLGDLAQRKASQKDLIRQRKNCKFCCKTYLNGRLYLCPRSAFATDLNYFDYPNDYVDIHKLDYSEKRKRIAELLYHKKYLLACAHCLAGTSMAIPIQPGEQDI